MNQKGFDWAEPVPPVSVGASPAPSSASPVLSQWPPAMAGLDDAWRDEVAAFFASPAGQALGARLQDALGRGERVYPPEPLRALALTPLAQVRVVVLGQDPYHGPGQAEGLAFSVAKGMAIPRSLQNIRLECQRTERVPLPKHGHLGAWAQRGVLLLNTTWTVSESQPASHAQWGWSGLTHRILNVVWQSQAPLVCLAWGGHAQQVLAELTARWPKNAGPRCILQANHPSPLSARRGPVPFLGCGHFQQSREWLQAQGMDWNWAFD